MDDSVFVGGCYYFSGQPYGLIACFSIQDFYNGGGSYKAEIYLPTLMPDIWTNNCFDHITNIRRLTLFKDGHGIRVVFIADNEIICGGILEYKRVGLGSTQYYAGWQTTDFLYNKDGIENFSDVIATENYVVAVSRTNDSSYFHLRTFPKSDFPHVYIAILTYRQGMNDILAKGNVMATPIEQDLFAVVYHYQDMSDEGVAVKEFKVTSPNGWVSFSQGVNIPLPSANSASWRMKDVRYLPGMDYIVALQYVYAPLSGNPAQEKHVVHWYDRGSLTSYAGRYVSGYEFHSLDKIEDSFFIVSGKYNSLDIFKERPYFFPSCGSYDVSGGDPVASPKIYNFLMPGNMNYPTIYNSIEPFNVYEETATRICNHE